MNNEPLVMRTHGIVLPNDAEVITPPIQRLIETDRYEAEEAQNLENVLQRGDVVLELGTGLGFITCLCARNDFVSAITTVEADPRLIRYVDRVFALNNVSDRIEFHHGVAMADPQEQSAAFYLREDFWASSLNPTSLDYLEAVSVPVIDLNRLIQKVEPSVLIVDIEGAEDRLFNGLDIGCVDRIYIEIHQHLIGGWGVKSVFDALSNLGFHYDSWGSQRTVVLFSRV